MCFITFNNNNLSTNFYCDSLKNPNKIILKNQTDL